MGWLELRLGQSLDGGETQTATTIRIDYDADITPIQQNITFGTNTNAVELAANLTSEIDAHGELTAVQGDTVVKTITEVRTDKFNAPFSGGVYAMTALVEIVPDLQPSDSVNTRRCYLNDGDLSETTLFSFNVALLRGSVVSFDDDTSFIFYVDKR